jgi:hypothetical protein
MVEILALTHLRSQIHYLNHRTNCDPGDYDVTRRQSANSRRPVIGGRALMTAWSCTCSLSLRQWMWTSEDHAAWIINLQTGRQRRSS